MVDTDQKKRDRKTNMINVIQDEVEKHFSFLKLEVW